MPEVQSEMQNIEVKYLLGCLNVLYEDWKLFYQLIFFSFFWGVIHFLHFIVLFKLSWPRNNLQKNVKNVGNVMSFPDKYQNEINLI